MRPIAPGDDLCIFYGTKVWFEDSSGSPAPSGEEEKHEDLWTHLASVELDQMDEDPGELIPETELPSEKLLFDSEEERG